MSEPIEKLVLCRDSLARNCQNKSILKDRNDASLIICLDVINATMCNLRGVYFKRKETLSDSHQESQG